MKRKVHLLLLAGLLFGCSSDGEEKCKGSNGILGTCPPVDLAVNSCGVFPGSITNSFKVVGADAGVAGWYATTPSLGWSNPTPHSLKLDFKGSDGGSYLIGPAIPRSSLGGGPLLIWVTHEVGELNAGSLTLQLRAPTSLTDDSPSPNASEQLLEIPIGLTSAGRSVVTVRTETVKALPASVTSIRPYIYTKGSPRLEVTLTISDLCITKLP